MTTLWLTQELTGSILDVGGGAAGMGRPVGPRAVCRRAVWNGSASGAVSGCQGGPGRSVCPAGLACEPVSVGIGRGTFLFSGPAHTVKKKQGRGF